jgi:hypothetical protein
MDWTLRPKNTVNQPPSSSSSLSLRFFPMHFVEAHESARLSLTKIFACAKVAKEGRLSPKHGMIKN